MVPRVAPSAGMGAIDPSRADAAPCDDDGACERDHDMKLLAILAGSTALAFLPTGLAAQDAVPPESQTEAPQAASATGTVREGPERRFTGADLFDLAIASDPQISPDGSRIA